MRLVSTLTPTRPPPHRHESNARPRRRTRRLSSCSLKLQFQEAKLPSISVRIWPLMTAAPSELEDVHDARIRSDEMHSTPRPHTVRVPPRRQVSATAPSGSFRRLRRRGHRQSKRFRHSTRDPAARRTPPHDFSGAKAPRVWVRRVDGLICDATLTMLEHRAAVYVQ